MSLWSAWRSGLPAWATWKGEKYAIHDCSGNFLCRNHVWLKSMDSSKLSQTQIDVNLHGYGYRTEGFVQVMLDVRQCRNGENVKTKSCHYDSYEQHYIHLCHLIPSNQARSCSSITFFLCFLRIAHLVIITHQSQPPPCPAPRSPRRQRNQDYLVE